MGPLLVTLALLPRPVLSGVEHTVDAGAFKVHYTLSGQDALAHGDLDEAPKNGVPDDADALLSGAQRVYDTHVTAGGMRAPLSDGALGGDERIDLYARKLDGPRGYAHVEEVNMAPATSAWLEVDPRTALESSSRLAAAAGHEAHHAIQFAYSPGIDDWMKEATATWVEVALFGLRAEERQHWRALAASPELTLDVTDGAREYDMMGFISFLVELHPPDPARELHRLWTSILERGSTYDGMVAFAGMPGALVMVKWAQYLVNRPEALVNPDYLAGVPRREIALAPWSFQAVYLEPPGPCWRVGDLIETDGSVALGTHSGWSALYGRGLQRIDDMLYERTLLLARGPAGRTPPR